MVEVRQGAGGEEEEEEEQEEATDIKSNNPHLAGGEKQQLRQAESVGGVQLDFCSLRFQESFKTEEDTVSRFTPKNWWVPRGRKFDLAA